MQTATGYTQAKARACMQSTRVEKRFVGILVKGDRRTQNGTQAMTIVRTTHYALDSPALCMLRAEE